MITQSSDRKGLHLKMKMVGLILPPLLLQVDFTVFLQLIWRFFDIFSQQIPPKSQTHCHLHFLFLTDPVPLFPSYSGHLFSAPIPKDAEASEQGWSTPAVCNLALSLLLWAPQPHPGWQLLGVVKCQLINCINKLTGIMTQFIVMAAALPGWFISAEPNTRYCFSALKPGLES